MNNNRKSWVWRYANRIGNKAYCSLCSENENNEFCCNGGSTESLGRHLAIINRTQPISNNSKSKRYVHIVLNHLKQTHGLQYSFARRFYLHGL